MYARYYAALGNKKSCCAQKETDDAKIKEKLSKRRSKNTQTQQGRMTGAPTSGHNNHAG